MFNEYPYTNANDLNLDYVLKTNKELRQAFEEFASTNGLKAADPIVWSVANQYAPNTIVVTNDGNAYISKKTVPAGILVENPDYWIKAFEFPVSAYDGDDETLEIGGNASGSVKEFFSKLKIDGLTINVKDSGARSLIEAQGTRIDNVNSRIDNYHVINVVEAGADPTGSQDCYPVLESIMNNNEACLIYFPKGVYKFNEGLTITKPFKFLGEMAAAESKETTTGTESWLKGVILHTPDSSNFSMFKVRCSGVQIENFCIQSDGFNNETTGIKIGLSNQGNYKCLVFRNLFFRNVTNGVLHDGSSIFKSIFENIWVWGCRNGFRFTSGTHTSLTFLNCWVTWCSSFGYWIAPSKMVYSSFINCACDNYVGAYYFKNLAGCSMVACGCEAPQTETGDNVQFTDCKACSAQFNIIYGTTLKKTSGRCIYLTDACEGITIHDCYAQGMPSGSLAPYGVQCTTTAPTNPTNISVYNFIGVTKNAFNGQVYSGVQKLAYT